MALTVGDHIKAVKMLGGGAVPIVNVTKASATTWLKGAIIIATSGLAVEAADGPTTGTILGVAAEAAEDGRTEALVYPALPNAVFSGRIATGDTGGDYTSLVTNRYIRYGLSLEGTSGTWYINAADTTDLAAMPIEFVDAIGTNLALVHFTFVDSLFNAI
jgi:hypothetical protein